MSVSGGPENPVSTVETALDIFEFLLAADGATLSEIAAEVDLAKSTVYRHLQTLRHREYIVKNGDTYDLSFRFLELGKNVQNAQSAYKLAEEKVRELATETEERAQFLIEEHGKAVYVFREKGSHAVRTDPGIGKSIALHSTAAGKAMLAHLPEDRVAEIIDRRGLPALTANTITIRSELFEELEQIRERGYSVNRQENIDGLRAIGTIIRDADSEVLGALSVSGPSHRMKGQWFQEELPNLLLGTANELELNIVHS